MNPQLIKEKDIADSEADLLYYINLVEKKLEDTERRYKSVIDHVKQVIFQTDMAGIWTFLNPVWTEITGFDVDESIGMLFLNYVHPDDRTLNIELFTPLIERKKDYCRHEIRYLTKCGGYKWIEVFARLTLDDDQSIIGTSGTLTDITDRKNLEIELAQHRTQLENLVSERTEELQRSERKYRTLVENIPAVISRCDKELRYTYRSPQWEEYFNLHNKPVIGKTWRELGIAEEIYRPWRKQFTEVLHTGCAAEFETQYPNKSGETRYYIVRVVPETDEKGQVESLLAVSFDITERKSIDAEMQRLDRLNTVGEMAAAIGHEVRNPLTTVRGYLQMFQGKEKMAEHHKQIGTMIEELDRANSIISEFLSLVKDKKLALKPTYLNATIRHLLPLLQAAAIREDKEIATEFTDVPKIVVDEDEIRQCVLNLTRNALDAVPPGGVVTLLTDWDGRNTVSLAVKDTGPGIPPGVLETLGKPFVTTKATGTGLGLPICFRIAERHNASIKVDTGSMGTTISIEFPTTEPVEN
jgi:two-component system, sporulation sensor kinase E